MSGALADTAGTTLRLFLCGDVMTGRGIDQVLPHPGDPTLHERFVKSAEDYVELAERANGTIPRPVGFAYIWGDALAHLAAARPDARIVNLETSITRSDSFVPKGINYRMSPENAPCLAAAGIDCCVLANNHVLDWGAGGLLDTLEALERAGIAVAGAGRHEAAAAAPAVLDRPGKGRILIYGFGHGSSGIPANWAATAALPGVNYLPDLSPRTLAPIARQIAAAKRPGDVVVASIHWGGNWGYDIPVEQRRFAHGLIDEAGVDVVHGHSSHHVKGIEVHAGRLVLYGCGDFLTDYEGIRGHERYRAELVLMYLPDLDPATGRLAALRMQPFQLRRFRLHSASAADAAWLANVLDREGRKLGSRVERGPDGALTLLW